jgi:type II secretory pathway pseudopilin PulG
MPKPVASSITRQAGYTYLGLLFLLAVMATVNAASLRIGTTLQRSVAEQELLDKGLSFTRAFESYARATPAGGNPYPVELQDLLRDPRYPDKMIRHLRRIEVDPMTGRAEWGVKRQPSNRGITGVHSLSDQTSLRRDLQAPFRDFNDETYYRDWVFVGGLGEEGVR